MAPRPPTSLYIQTPDPAAIRGASSPVFPVPWLRGCPVSFQWEAGFFKFNFGKGTGSSNPRDSRHTSLRSYTVGDAYFGCDVILHYEGRDCLGQRQSGSPYGGWPAHRCRFRSREASARLLNW